MILFNKSWKIKNIQKTALVCQRHPNIPNLQKRSP